MRDLAVQVAPGDPAAWFDAVAFLRDSASGAAAWPRSDGKGITIGLADTLLEEGDPDLSGASLTVRDFTGESRDPASARAKGHATDSALLLVGQGRSRVRGIVPGARLAVASVIGRDAVASPARLAAALDWLVAVGAQVVVLPLGDSRARPSIAHRINRATRRGVVFFAATGNAHPAPLAFPARHRRVISVAGVDDDGNVLLECCRRPRVDLLAPGVVRLPGEGGLRRGSSVAAVLAAGVAASLLGVSAVSIAPPRVLRSRLVSALRQVFLCRSNPSERAREAS